MNFKRTLIILFILLCSACSSDDHTISVAADDPEMLAAMAKGHETLPNFFEIYENPKNGESDFSLKMKISDGDLVEYFWMINLKREGGKLYGEIGNDPDIVANVKIGEKMEILDDQVVDWLYIRNEKIVGNFTIKPLLKHMSESEAKEYREMLYEP